MATDYREKRGGKRGGCLKRLSFRKEAVGMARITTTGVRQESCKQARTLPSLETQTHS